LKKRFETIKRYWRLYKFIFQLDPIVDVETIAILTIGAGIKAVLYILCRKHGTVSATVLAQDQGNDVITNITALAGAYLGHRFWIYADPLGAFLVW
jgi:hypothetical protein